LGSAVLIFLVNQGDKLILARFLNVKELGFYSVAWKLAVFLTALTGVIQKVMFPVYAKLADDRVRLKKYYLKVR